MIVTPELHTADPLADVYGEAERYNLAPWEIEFGERVDALFWEFFDKSEDPDGWNRRWVINRGIDWQAVTNEPWMRISPACWNPSTPWKAIYLIFPAKG